MSASGFVRARKCKLLDPSVAGSFRRRRCPARFPCFRLPVRLPCSKQIRRPCFTTTPTRAFSEGGRGPGQPVCPRDGRDLRVELVAGRGKTCPAFFARREPPRRGSRGGEESM